MRYLYLIVIFLGAVSLYAQTLEERISLLEAQLQSVNRPGDLNISFPGQYRINFYSIDNDISTTSRQNAARLRIRQNIDIRFDKRLKSSVRLQLNHTNDNITNAGDINGNDVQIRHAYIDYQLTPSTHIKTGLVPVTEYQEQLLYSAPWGYNPFAVEGFTDAGAWKWHYFAAALQEGSESNSTDDQIHYQADLGYEFSDVSKITLSATMMELGYMTQKAKHYNGAIKARWRWNSGYVFKVAALVSQTDKVLLATSQAGHGTAYLMKLSRKTSKSDTALMATFARGEADGSGFLSPMAFTGTYAYWGYTGVVTVQYQTDTGFASDGLQLSNNGYGMNSVQLKQEWQLSAADKLYVGAGWFGASQAANRSSEIAHDLVVMNKQRLHKGLTLDVGAVYAKIYDSLSGYGQTVLGGAGFNQNAGTVRYKKGVFGRLQLQF